MRTKQVLQRQLYALTSGRALLSHFRKGGRCIGDVPLSGALRRLVAIKPESELRRSISILRSVTVASYLLRDRHVTEAAFQSRYLALAQRCFSNADATAKALKSYCVAQRAKALGAVLSQAQHRCLRKVGRLLGWIGPRRGSRHERLQFSSLSRGLPVPSDIIVEDALWRHREDLSRDVPYDPSVAALVSQFCESWGNDHLPFGEPSPVLQFTGGKTYSSNAYAKEANDLYPDYYDFSLPDYGDGPESMIMWPDEDIGTYVADFHPHLLHETEDVEVYWKIYDQFRYEPLVCRAVALKCSGFKVRVVTCAPAWVTLLGHWPRRTILRAIKSSEFSGPMFEISGETLSSDLTRCSDLIPFWVGQAVVRGLRRARPAWVSEFFDVIELISGSYRVEYEDMVSLESSSGLLMGCPMTWCIVTLWHAAIARKCFTIYRVCGDDLVAPTDRNRSARYGDYMQRSGAVINHEKAFVSWDSCIYMEEAYIDGRHDPVFKVSVFSDAWESGCRGHDSLLYATIGPAVSAEAEASGLYYEASVLTRTLLADIVLKFNKARIPPYLPRSMGGAGLPYGERLCPLSRLVPNRAYLRMLATLLYTKKLYRLALPWMISSSPYFKIFHEEDPEEEGGYDRRYQTVASSSWLPMLQGKVLEATVNASWSAHMDCYRKSSAFRPMPYFRIARALWKEVKTYQHATKTMVDDLGRKPFLVVDDDFKRLNDNIFVESTNLYRKFLTRLLSRHELDEIASRLSCIRDDTA